MQAGQSRMGPPPFARFARWGDPRSRLPDFRNQVSNGLIDPAGSDATGADLDPPGGVVHNGLDGFQIWINGMLRFIVGMTDLETDGPSFAADGAYIGHGNSPLLR
jgi:hypothetical protein